MLQIIHCVTGFQQDLYTIPPPLQAQGALQIRGWKDWRQRALQETALARYNKAISLWGEGT